MGKTEDTATSIFNPTDAVESTATAEKLEPPKPQEGSQNEPKRQAFVEGSELDLAFALDCTGSMGSYIQSAKENIQSIALKLVQSEKAQIRFALVSYRDHPPQDHTYVTKVHPFTPSFPEMESYISQQQASGGGDGPEAVTSALHQSLNLPWRPNATKILVIIADAPPHGLGEMGDGFPNGDPDGHDPLDIARRMSERGICVFVVACEPGLSSYGSAVDFFQYVAMTTGGMLLPLTSAALLPDVIVGGAQEQMDMERLLEEFKKEAEEAKRQGAKTEQEVRERIHSVWSGKGVTTRQMKVESVYSEESKVDSEWNVQQYAGSRSLGEARGKVKSVSNRIDGKKGASLFGGGAPPPPSSSWGAVGGAPLFGASSAAPAKRKSAGLFGGFSFGRGGGASRGGGFGSSAPGGVPPPAAPFSFGASGAPPPAPLAPGAPSFSFGGPSAMPGPPPPPPAAGMAAPPKASVQSVDTKEEVISYDQIERLFQQSSMRKTA